MKKEEDNMEDATQAKTITSDDDFVIAWQTGTSAQQVADDLNLKRASVIQRACGLRNKGVRLKKFPRVNNGRQARGEDYYVNLLELAAQHGELSAEVQQDEESANEDAN